MIRSSVLLILAAGLCGASVLQSNQNATTAPSSKVEETTDLKWLHAVGQHQQVNRTQTSSAEQEPEASANWLSFLSNGNEHDASANFDDVPRAPIVPMQQDDSQLIQPAMSMIPAGRRRFDDNAALASTGPIRGNPFSVPESEINEFNNQLQQQLSHLKANDVNIDEEALIRSLTGVESNSRMRAEAMPQRRMDYGNAPLVRRPRYQKPVRPIMQQHQPAPQHQQQQQQFKQPIRPVAEKRSGYKAPTIGSNTYYSTKSLNTYANQEQAVPLQKEETEQPVELDDIFRDDDKTGSHVAAGKRVEKAASSVSAAERGNTVDDEESDADEQDESDSQARLRTDASELLNKDELEKRRPLMRGIEDPASLSDGSMNDQLDQQEEGEQTSVSLKKAKQPKHVDIVLQGTKAVDASSASNNDDDESSAASHMTKSATDLQAAAGHHHGHSHGHYYQYVEVPKKKAWKFGFKRGNHKHTIMREEKGYKNKFHSSFKWHAKEKCKKHHKCASHGKMTWHYEHHDKKKGHY